MNAGPPIDAEAVAMPVAMPDEATEDLAPPETHLPTGSISEEMVGLPEQIPGYPGQQRSIDTS